MVEEFWSCIDVFADRNSLRSCSLIFSKFSGLIRNRLFPSLSCRNDLSFRIRVADVAALPCSEFAIGPLFVVPENRLNIRDREIIASVGRYAAHKILERHLHSTNMLCESAVPVLPGREFSRNPLARVHT